MIEIEFNKMLVATLPILRAYALKLTRDGDRALDLVQNACVLMLHYHDSYDEQRGVKFSSWACVVLHHEFTNGFRRSRKDRVLVEYNPTLMAGAVQPAQEHYVALRELLDRIAQPQRRFGAINLMTTVWHALGYTEVEVMAMTGLRSRVTVRTQRRRAQRALAQ